MERSPHLTDDEVELYVLRRLDEVDYQSIKDHLLECTSCSKRVDDEGVLVANIRRALVGRSWAWIHHTHDGDIRLDVVFSESLFIGRITGATLDCGNAFDTKTDARHWCKAAFADMFPEHRCGRECKRL